MSRSHLIIIIGLAYNPVLYERVTAACKNRAAPGAVMTGKGHNGTPIIYDCGVMQTPTSIFRDADHRLLCGSVLPYEIPVFHKALSECGSLEVRPVAICVPQEIQEYCMELFGEDVQIAAASHDLFAKRANGQIYRPLVEKYIAGEKRL